MGLDQYVRKIKLEDVISDFDFVEVDEDRVKLSLERIFYWRKAYEIDKWMTNLFFENGGSQKEYDGGCFMLRL